MADNSDNKVTPASRQYPDPAKKLKDDVATPMFGAAGAIATTDQEANQLQFPVTIPLLIGFFMAYTVMVDADSTMAVAGTLIPWTAPVVVPFRAVMTDIPLGEYLLAAVLMVVAVAATMWVAAKIYRIGVLSTGRKPTMKELVRWVRTA